MALPSHPLHRLYGPRSFFPSGFGIRTCGARRHVQGRVTSTFGSIRLVDDRGRARAITVGPHTHFRGFLRNGLPFLQPGDRVRLSVEQCELRQGGPILVAQSIAPR